ncbi:2-C-methyl-D-erythritol 4-phosphate cytidylyltransferase [Hoyosella rhizosphaerae]|uniref:2-C-methyl-D-erythritol 4-phosphate cytidylyltransferase n=1 Tax=Hoyosella rhizosphaerae TaxID=1755582 RepID=A0A916XJR0_9ACTN|nr:2-C-methyl-D-erythritol 4-phosphate cytidylyltransferase [Hoyosella rhizosphaerae]MBN4925297.1 2-C-methyl-D-erythritol 4-phosphate cytidylyltransferase [Hoyosella rhizosphaerae]GGC76408.1 2-C-methyl-D-erythritol 4-phosphate cytidylyltransferase [Hoyosella rhizosphaerae]
MSRQHRRIAAIVPAAGMGTRLGGALPKAYVSLGGRPLLSWAVEGLRNSGVVDSIIVLGAPDRLQQAREIVGSDVLVLAGGVERSDSVKAGLDAVGDVDYVLVHDAARALTPPSMIRRIADALFSGADAVIPVLPVVDTIKTVDSDGCVTGTPVRATLRAVQTPQGFRAELLRAAHDAAIQSGADVTDDAMLVEKVGATVRTVDGHSHAFKVTTPLDLTLAEALVASQPTLLAQ